MLLALGFAALIVRALYRTRHPATGPETSQPPEGWPTIANLLTNDLEVDDDAAVAVVLELARQGTIEIVNFGNEREVVFLRRPDRVPPDPASRMVYDFIAAQPQLDNGIPIEALRDANAGHEDDFTRWWKTFSAHIVDQARGMGLVALRFPQWLVRGLQGAAGLLFFLALFTLGQEEGAPRESQPSAASMVVLLGSAGVALALLNRLDAHALRYTDAGRQMASRWLGFQAAAEKSVTLVEARPAAITVLGSPHVAAAAVGVARETERRLQLAVGNGSSVWWVDQGRWQHTKVRYPGGAYGSSPWSVLWSGLVPFVQFGTMLGIAGFGAFSVWDSLTDDRRGDATMAASDWLREHSRPSAFQDDPNAVAILVGGLIATVVLVVFTSVVIGALINIIRALTDLLGRRTRTGQVILRRGGWLAIAGPGDAKVTAFQIARRRGKGHHDPVGVGHRAEVRTTWLLRHVLSVRGLAP